MKYLEPSTLPAVPQVKLDLIAAKELIADEENWCKGTGFHMINGTIVARCAIRAVIDAVNFNSARIKAARAAFKSVLPRKMSVEEFNDYTSHLAVMRLFDDAIKGVEQ
jgi:hypothetical protein